MSEFSPAVKSAMARFEEELQASVNKQRAIDVGNLRFYASLFRKEKWETDVFSWGVFEATLNEIAGRISIYPGTKKEVGK